MRRSRYRAWGLAGAVLVLAATGCGGGSPGAPPVRLDAGPAAGALVDPVHVSVRGLPPAALVTVQARAPDREGQPWVSAAVFRASAAGTLNLATAVPVSGSYHTADAAGLLWSLHPAPGTSHATGSLTSTQRASQRLGHRAVLDPHDHLPAPPRDPPARGSRHVARALRAQLTGPVLSGGREHAGRRLRITGVACRASGRAWT